MKIRYIPTIRIIDKLAAIKVVRFLFLHGLLINLFKTKNEISAPSTYRKNIACSQKNMLC